MASITRTIRTAFVPRINCTIFAFRGTSDECGSDGGGSKKSSDKKGGVDDIPCLLCPCSGDTNNPSAPTIYDSRKFGHMLSTDNVCPCFETLPDIPTGVFRNTTGEILGRGAGKCTYYQNPEYFSFHHMSFYDFNLALRQYRSTCPRTGRKPN